MRRRRSAGAILVVALTLTGPADAGGGDGLDAAVGRALFERPWVSAPSSTAAADGLGPLYAARSCVACHPAAGRGRPPAPEGGGHGFAVRLPDDPVYGRQLQPFGVAGHAGEGRVSVAFSEETIVYPDGAAAVLRRPAVRVDDLGYGPLSVSAVSVRVAPSLHGVGLLERIPEDAILALADPEDRDGDGVSGRAARLPDGRLGRFGWKAAHAAVGEQNAEAFFLDLGLSTPLHRAPWGDCTQAQAACRSAPHGDSPQFEGLEIPSAVLALLDAYVRALPAPAPGRHDPDGAAVFAATGCTACHRPTLPTDRGDVAAYTDLLLHDLGPGLADGVPGPAGSGAEWRTPPLWGLTAGAGLLHDGRARSVEEAILWHEGEARSARDRFMALPARDRDRLLRFVEAL